MLKGINPIITPDLLKILSEMGHGDEIVLADANFPSASTAKRLIRIDAVGMAEILEAVLMLFPLDQYNDNHFALMERCKKDTFDIPIWDEYKKILNKSGESDTVCIMERFDFYDRAKQAYAIVATGERQQYANIILKKGCVLD